MENIEYQKIYDLVKDYDDNQLEAYVENEYNSYRINSALSCAQSYPSGSLGLLGAKHTLEDIKNLILQAIETKHEQLKQYFESNPDKTKFTLYLIEIVAPIVLLEDKDFTTKLVVACILSVLRMGIDDILKK